MWSSSFQKRRTAVSTRSHVHVRISAFCGCVSICYAALCHLSGFIVSLQCCRICRKAIAAICGSMLYCGGMKTRAGVSLYIKLPSLTWLSYSCTVFPFTLQKVPQWPDQTLHRLRVCLDTWKLKIPNSRANSRVKPTVKALALIGKNVNLNS